MIQLQDDKLKFSFPELPYQPCLEVVMARTLRIPDDGKDYPLPPGLGRFPMRHIDDHDVPFDWLKRGGVLVPMWQSEAMWLHFSCSTAGASRRLDYPFAIKVATGKINAVSGEVWADGLSRNPQNYLVAPEQPWLDGYCVEKGIIRQFVAMPLGQGVTAEEQITGKAEFGGLQIEAFPLKPAAFQKLLERQRLEEPWDDRVEFATLEMGLAPGGRMRQEIYEDPYSIHDWDTDHGSRVFVHLVNSTTWRNIAGESPPSTPLTAAAYTASGYPWFDYYDSERIALKGATRLRKLRSVLRKLRSVGEPSRPIRRRELDPEIVRIRQSLAPGQVREE